MVLTAKIRHMLLHERIAKFVVGDGVLDARAVDFGRQALEDLRAWCRVATAPFNEDSFEYQHLTVSMHRGIISLMTRMLENQKLEGDNVQAVVREFATVARDSAAAIVSLAIDPLRAFHHAVPYAVQPEFVDIAFPALLFLKLSRLFPSDLTPAQVVRQCRDLHSFILTECKQVRFALTIRVATERFARAFGLHPVSAPSGKVAAPMDTLDQQQQPDTVAETISQLGSAPFLELPVEWGTELPSWLESGSSMDADKDWEWQTNQPLDHLFLPMSVTFVFLLQLFRMARADCWDVDLLVQVRHAGRLDVCGLVRGVKGWAVWQTLEHKVPQSMTNIIKAPSVEGKLVVPT